MEQLTVTQVRTRLGKIMDVLLAADFNEKYQRGIQTVDIQSVTHEVLNIQGEDFIKSLAQHIHNKDRFAQALRTASDALFANFYLRYHTVTQHLVAQNQDNLLQVPEGKKEFFTYMLSDFLGRISAPVST